jgi:HK97 family phage major capsid protein
MANIRYDNEALRAMREEHATHLATAKRLVEAAKAAGRELTGIENDAVEKSMSRVTELAPRIKAQRSAAVDAVYKLDSADNYHGSGSLFSEEARKGLLTAVKSRSTFRTEVDVKAALTVGTLLPTSGTGVEPGLYPNAFPLATLFRTEQANGPSVRYYRLGDATAAVVAEGVAKPDSGVTVEPVDALLKKIATTVRFSDELSDDASFLIPYLQSELVSAVITKENAEILVTFTGTSGVLTGTGAATAAIDVIADAIAGQEALNGSAPSAVVVNPTVLATLRKVKASTGGDYVLDPLTAGPPTLHGVRVVATPATAAGTAWVVSGQGVIVYRRGPITAEIGMNSDDWNTNQRTMRVEERFTTAVVRPSMLTKLTLT